MRRSWIGVVVLSLTTWALAGVTVAAEDAIPGDDAVSPTEDYSQYQSRSAFSPSRWSIDRGYPGEVAEKLMFGVVDLVTAPVEFVATPFRRAYWADTTRRPVLEFFAFGLPEGAMNAGFRAWTGVGNIATFPIASSQNRFNNYSIWFWDRYGASL